MRFNRIKEIFWNKAHIERAIRSDTENQKYCSKDNDFFEHGTPSNQGKRSDLERLSDTVFAGERDFKAICEEYPSAAMRYGRGIREFIATVHRPEPRNFKTELYYFWGPSGSGKSRRTLEEAEALGDDIFQKPPDDRWWDGYKQQPSVIIDDFHGEIPYSMLLRVCDRYPCQVPIKGGYEVFNSKRIWISSMYPIQDLPIYQSIHYKPEALIRRCTIYEYMGLEK